MFVVNGTTLSLSRGDGAYLYVGASLGDGDRLEFRVYGEKLLFSCKQLPDGTFPIPTEDLYGDYTYKIVLINGATETVKTTGTLSVRESKK